MACWLFRLPRLPCLSYKAMERSGGEDIVEFVSMMLIYSEVHEYKYTSPFKLLCIHK